VSWDDVRAALPVESRAVQPAFGRHGPRHYLAQLKRDSLGRARSRRADGIDKWKSTLPTDL